MAAPPHEAPAAKADAPAAEAAPKKKLLGSKKVKIALIVVVVMALQAVAAFLLLPKGQATPAAGQSAEASSHGGEVAKTEKADNLIEAEIGSFSVSLEENSGILWNISFKLYATVAKEAKSEFEDLVGERFKAHIKQAVVKIVRRSSIEDLRDPQLDLFKRNLKTEINNVLPERYIQEIIVFDIRTMQQ